MSWVAVGAAAVSVVGGAIVSNNNRPDAPGQRNLTGELGNLGAEYPNILQNFLGGQSGYNTNFLGGLNALTSGTQTFSPDAFFAARPDAKAAWDAHWENGENAGWSIEQFANAFDADATKKYNSQTNPGLPQISGGLNTATRTNNLQDVLNLGPLYTGLTRAANQPYYSALDNFTQAASKPVQQSAPQQQAAGLASQGFGTFNPSGLYANTNFTSQQVQAPNSYLSVNAPGGSPLLGQLNQQAMNQGPSTLQQSQNALAAQLLAQGGTLSPSELRNVQQSSRAGFAARGLDATNASVVDEALQTDAAQRQRLVQNLGIAQGIQNQGLAEQGQQEQFGLGVNNANLGYGQLGVQAQTANQNAFNQLNQLNLAGQQSNQSANLQAQNLGLQGQLANQQFGLGSFNANLNSQQMQQQALQQAAALQEQQRQAQLAAQAQAVGLQRQGFLDPFAAVIGSADQNLFGQILGTNQANAATQANLYGALLGYGQDLNNTNYNANAAANIAGYNANQNLYGSLISAGSNLGGAYLANRTQSPSTTTPTYTSGLDASTMVAGGVCWVARSVFGEDNPLWKEFRKWLFLFAPNWFFWLYANHGEKFAGWLNRHPWAKRPIRRWMLGRIHSMHAKIYVKEIA